MFKKDCPNISHTSIIDLYSEGISAVNVLSLKIMNPKYETEIESDQASSVNSNPKAFLKTPEQKEAEEASFRK